MRYAILSLPIRLASRRKRQSASLHVFVTQAHAFCEMKKSYISFAVASIAALSEGGLSRLSDAQELSCQKVIESVRSDINERLGANVYSIVVKDIKYHPLSPYRQNTEVQFSLGQSTSQYRDRKSIDVMNSSSLLMSFSDKIIKGCNNIVRVDFGLRKTDWIRSYSWMDNRYTREDECVQARRDGQHNLVWGQQICL
jgi:hypothetical protein